MNSRDSCNNQIGKQPRCFDSAFAWRMAILILVGYCLATVPQVILDARLKSDVNFPGGRQYQHAYLLFPIAVTVFFTSLAMALSASARLRLLTVVPFVIGCLVSAPIFRPVPHGNLVFISSVWIVLCSLTIWIRGHRIANPAERVPQPAIQACVEYLKEHIAFWRGLGFALMVAYIGVVIGLVQSLNAANTQFLSDRRDLLLMDRYQNIAIALMSLFVLLGPLYEVATKVLAATELLLMTERPKE
jgi:hypothetical protein